MPRAPPDPKTEDAAAFLAYLRDRLANGAPALMARAQASPALDSGASRHITDVRNEEVVGDVRPIAPLAVRTILGPVTRSEAVPVGIPRLGVVEHLHVEGAPSVLCLGQLVEDRCFEVRWKSTRAGGNGFELYAAAGAKIPTKLEDYVPVLDEAGAAHLAQMRDLPHEETYRLVVALISSMTDEQLLPLVNAFTQSCASRAVSCRTAKTRTRRRSLTTRRGLLSWRSSLSSRLQ